MPPPESIAGLPLSRAAEPRDSAGAPRRFRAPRENGAILIEPAAASVAALASATHERLGESDQNIQGRTLGRLRRWARESCLASAAEYTTGLGGGLASEVSSDALLFIGGHQPALFHPGVWVKNFLIGAYAAKTGGVALNLVVDNDTLTSTSIRVPEGTAVSPQLGQIPFDAPRLRQPWEDAHIDDRELFASFGERAGRAMSDWGIDPVISELWPMAVAHGHRSDRLADCLTAARHGMERQWGLQNLELPVSRMCEQPAFQWFAGHLLAHLPRFREIHNAALWEYRRANKVRSHAHPVPELAEHDGWLEAPFWVWAAGDKRRKNVFAQQSGKLLLLSDGTEVFARLPLSPDMDACCAVEALGRLAQRGIRFRTRALTTTLFARLCLADLFVHGIGGAKYDEITDRLIARFYRLSAPPFVTATATLHLPLDAPEAAASDESARLKTALRDLRFNPERARTVRADPALLSEKAKLIEEGARASERRLSVRERRARRNANRARHERLQQIASGLAGSVQDEQRELQAQLDRAERSEAAHVVLKSREFAYCLYPAETLRGLMGRAAGLVHG